jgi:hypothetical protein
MREMILAEDEGARRKALAKLLPFQRKDFEGILKAMDGLPVTVRLLDPPLHEFLPHEPEAVAHVAEALGVPVDEVRERARRLHEMNPMLGHRGCRLGITYPEIYEMQVQALFEAATRNKKKGLKPKPEVMIPLVGAVAEYVFLRDRLVKVAKDVMAKKQQSVPVVFGTMIEIPRAALLGAEIGAEAEFFSPVHGNRRARSDARASANRSQVPRGQRHRFRPALLCLRAQADGRGPQGPSGGAGRPGRRRGVRAIRRRARQRHIDARGPSGPRSAPPCPPRHQS